MHVKDNSTRVRLAVVIVMVLMGCSGIISDKGLAREQARAERKMTWSLGSASWVLPASLVMKDGSAVMAVTITASPSGPSSATVDVVPSVTTTGNLKFTFDPESKTVRTSSSESIEIRFRLTVPDGQQIPPDGLEIRGRAVLINPSSNSLITGPDFIDSTKTLLLVPQQPTS